jgi:hypothetical protein
MVSFAVLVGDRPKDRRDKRNQEDQQDISTDGNGRTMDTMAWARFGRQSSHEGKWEAN